ncbi:MAG: hypothetical protein KAT58_00830 [candidate division Zixibacteria bacterium]|nr:hypothetical protein [candidate division Zixibacteria bacterium]
MIRLSLSRTIVVLFTLAAVISFSCSQDDNGTNSQNHPPVITSLTADPDTFYAEQFTTITVIASDPDGDDLNYNWEAHGSGFMSIPSEPSTLVLTNCCTVTEPITAVVLSIVDDGQGGEAHDSVQVWILPIGGE